MKRTGLGSCWVCLLGLLAGCGGGADPVVPKLPGPNTTIHDFSVTGTSAPDQNGVVPIVLVADKATFILNWEVTAATAGYFVDVYLSQDDKIDYDQNKPLGGGIDAWFFSNGCGLVNNTCGRSGTQQCQVDLAVLDSFGFLKCTASDPGGQDFGRFFDVRQPDLGLPKNLFVIVKACDITFGTEDCKFKAVPVFVTR